MTQKPQGKLVETFGLFTAIILVGSSIIGSGIFKKVAPMSEQLLSPGLVLLCWGLAGLISLIGAFTAAEVSGLLAGSGGQYIYFRKMYGETFAFFYGWACFTAIQSASIASIAYVFSQSLNALIPMPQPGEAMQAFSLFGGIFYPFENLGVKALAIGLIAMLTLVNYRGIRFGGGLSTIVTLTIVTGIAVVILLAFASGQGTIVNIQNPAPDFSLKFGGENSNGALFKAIFAAMLSAFWAYEGWNSLGFIGGEIKNAKRNLPLALFFGMLAIITIYLAVNFAYLYVMPVGEMAALSQGSTNTIAAVAVMQKLLGPAGVLFISVLIVVATFGCTNATIMMAPRIYNAMARDGIFFRQASNIHPRFHTPGPALLYQGFWASMLVLSGSFDQLTDMLIFASFIFYGANAVGVFVLRRKMPDAPRSYRVPGYPVVPALFILFCAVLVVNTMITQPREAGMGLTLILLGTPFYLYWRKKAPKQS